MLGPRVLDNVVTEQLPQAVKQAVGLVVGIRRRDQQDPRHAAILERALESGVPRRTYPDDVTSEPVPPAGDEPVSVEFPAEPSPHDTEAGYKIVRGGIWRTLAFVFGSALGVVSIAVVSRTFGPSEFAVFVTIMSLLTVATSLSDFGLLALGIREYSVNDQAQRDRTQRAMLTLRLIFSLVAVGAMLVFATQMDFSSSVLLGTALAGIGLCALSLQVAYNVPLHAIYALRTIAGLDVGRTILLAVGMILAAVLTGEVAVVLAVYLPVGMVLLVTAMLLSRRIAPIRPSWDPESMRRLIGMVGIFAFAGSMGAIYPYVAQVATDAVMADRESGLFGLAFRAFIVAVAAGMTAISGAFPLLVVSAREDRARFRYAIRRIIQTGAFLGAGIAVTLSAGAEFAARLLGGDEFAGAADSLAVIALAMPASFVLVTGSNVLLAAGRNRVLVVISAGGAALSVAATVLLAESYGPTGAAAGIVAGETAIALGYVIAISRTDAHALPRGRWWLGLALAGGLGCAVQLLSLDSLLSAVVAGIVFAVAAIVLKLAPPELTDKVNAISALRKRPARD